ncbi:MAG: hypothetical protein R3176_04905 [Woeseiaceae bacterium]|nr:hypothetical protein [Woeseiaceae bacterium]
MTALTVSLAAGCAQTKGWFDGMRKDSAAPADSVILGAPEAEEYLAELYALAGGDPATQAEIYADAESAATLTPDPQSNLRFAMVLATPGHPESDPARANSMLRELLARPELMTPAELALATVHLKSSERLMMLDAETERLRSANSRAARSEQQALNQRLAAIEAENRELRRQLDEAEEKLEAITSIEQSIRAQDQ